MTLVDWIIISWVRTNYTSSHTLTKADLSTGHLGKWLSKILFIYSTKAWTKWLPLWDHIFKCILLKENIALIQISLKVLNIQSATRLQDLVGHFELGHRVCSGHTDPLRARETWKKTYVTLQSALCMYMASCRHDNDQVPIYMKYP